MDVIQQLSHLDFRTAFHDGKLSLSTLLAVDFIEIDRRLGICYMPLYELSGENWEMFASGRDGDAIEEKLKDIGVRQYFFPPLHHAALGIIDRGRKDEAAIREDLPFADRLEHPLQRPELVDADVEICDIVDALQERGLVAEGEVGFEITEQGHQVRGTVKFRPREAFISRFLNKVNLEFKLSTEGWFSITKK